MLSSPQGRVSHLLAALLGIQTFLVASGQQVLDPSGSVSRTTGNAYLLSFGTNHGDIQTLIAGEPVRALVRPGQRHSLQFAVQEVNGTLPDVFLTLRATDAGDADLYCLSLGTLAGEGESVGPHNNVWWSNHSSGNDYVFISRDHAEYAVLRLTVANGEKVVRGAAFSCAGDRWRQGAGLGGLGRAVVAQVVRMCARFRPCCTLPGDLQPWIVWIADPQFSSDAGCGPSTGGWKQTGDCRFPLPAVSCLRVDQPRLAKVYVMALNETTEIDIERIKIALWRVLGLCH